jgi:hypothetical protein
VFKRRKRQWPQILILGLGAGLLMGCAHPMPQLSASHTLLVSGRETQSMNAPDTQRFLLARAARLTVDHGYRFFAILEPAIASGTPDPISLKPGTNLTIRLYRPGEARMPGYRIWDAYALLSPGRPAPLRGPAQPG